MRETIFRGKRVDNGEWVYGDLIHEPFGYCIQYLEEKEGVYRRCKAKVIPETVGQYTGLTDKNGRKIFEWDIVEWFGRKYTVVYKEGRFIGEEEQIFGVDEYRFINLYGCLEVVGNVHDGVQ